MAEENEHTDDIDLEELIGNVLEARGFTVDRASKLDALDSLGENLGKRVEDLFRAANSGGGNSGSTPAPFDKDGFLGEVGALIDSKLAGLNLGSSGSGNEKKAPMFQRFLGVKGN